MIDYNGKWHVLPLQGFDVEEEIRLRLKNYKFVDEKKVNMETIVTALDHFESTLQILEISLSITSEQPISSYE